MQDLDTKHSNCIY